jgi:signal transduction histidine kinase
VLGGDADGDFGAKARQFRLMFTSEGIFMGLLIIAGIALLYRSILRENRLRMEQERFLTGATHHLKTPLATVRLGIESLLAGSMPEHKHEKYLNAMLREVNHLEKDLTNLLTAGGLKAYGRGLQMVAGDLADDVRDALESMQDRFEAAGITLETHIDDGLVIARDREAIHLILHNLLDNAVKYSPRGGRVSLSLSRDEDSARLAVHDSGRGIAPDELPRVFDRFFRGSHRDHLGGSGIGLYLVRELVESHGGTVEVKSDGLDHGSSFAARFPLAEQGS